MKVFTFIIDSSASWVNNGVQIAFKDYSFLVTSYNKANARVRFDIDVLPDSDMNNIQKYIAKQLEIDWSSGLAMYITDVIAMAMFCVRQGKYDLVTS